jgi:hypothetical protein
MPAGRDGERRVCRIQNLFDDLAVMDLAARHDEVQRSTLAVNDGVDFRGTTAATDADRLILLPLLHRWQRGGPSRWCCQSGEDRRAISRLASRRFSSKYRAETSD